MTPNQFLHRHSYGDDEFVRDLGALLNAERDLYAAGIAELVKQRDEAHARAEKAESALLNVHDALHAECDGSADLAAEVRALRARAEKAEAARDEARAALLSSAHAQREACAKMVGAHMRLPIAPEAEMLVRSTPLVTPRSPYESRPTLDNGGR